MYLPGDGAPTISPTGGRRVLLADDAVGTDLALSALRLSGGIPPDDELTLVLRNLVCTGETGCDCGIDMCGRL